MAESFIQYPPRFVSGPILLIVRVGFDPGLPLIQQLSVLAGTEWEASALRGVLFPGQAS